MHTAATNKTTSMCWELQASYYIQILTSYPVQTGTSAIIIIIYIVLQGENITKLLSIIVLSIWTFFCVVTTQKNVQIDKTP